MKKICAIICILAMMIAGAGEVCAWSLFGSATIDFENLPKVSQVNKLDLTQSEAEAFYLSILLPVLSDFRKDERVCAEVREFLTAFRSSVSYEPNEYGLLKFTFRPFALTVFGSELELFSDLSGYEEDIRELLFRGRYDKLDKMVESLKPEVFLDLYKRVDFIAGNSNWPEAMREIAYHYMWQVDENLPGSEPIPKIKVCGNISSAINDGVVTPF